MDPKDKEKIPCPFLCLSLCRDGAEHLWDEDKEKGDKETGSGSCADGVEQRNR